MVVSHAVDLSRGDAEAGRQPLYHSPFVAAEIGHFQQIFVGKNHLIRPGEGVQHPALDLLETEEVLLKNHLGPRGGDVLNSGALGIAGTYLFHVGVRDKIGAEHIDFLSEIGFQTDVRKDTGQPG